MRVVVSPVLIASAFVLPFWAWIVAAIVMFGAGDREVVGACSCQHGRPQRPSR